MRGPLLACWLCATVVAGCLVPGPITERQEQNQPLALRLERVRPSPEVPVWIDRSIPEDEERVVRFRVAEGEAVTDPDGDRLHYYWYLDYNPLGPGLESVFGSEYILDPCGGGRDFAEKQEFVLTAIVSDRELSFTPTFRTFPPEAHTAQITWRVVLYGTCGLIQSTGGGVDALGSSDANAGGVPDSVAGN